MKSKFAIVFAMLVVLPILGAVSAHAQLDDAVRADVPFDFYAGTQKMPAGLYYVTFDLDSDVVQLNDNNGHSVLMRGFEADEVAFQQPKLIFDHLGDNYFLKQCESQDLDLAFSVKKEESSVAVNAVPTPVSVAMAGL
jgi:hypothetical protein